jgi:hypothetical protein
MTHKDTLQKSSSCDTLIAGTYTGIHYRDEDQHFNFATPNSFLNHFNEDNPLYTVCDFVVNYNAKNKYTVVVVDLLCKKTNENVLITAKGTNIVSAMIDLLIKMF